MLRNKTLYKVSMHQINIKNAEGVEETLFDSLNKTRVVGSTGGAPQEVSTAHLSTPSPTLFFSSIS